MLQAILCYVCPAADTIGLDSELGGIIANWKLPFPGMSVQEALSESQTSARESRPSQPIDAEAGGCYTGTSHWPSLPLSHC